MARILNDFEFRSTENRQSHPWSVWADGKIRELVRGSDFNCKTTTVATQARGYAKKNGMKVRISAPKDSDNIVLQFIKVNAEAPAPAATEAPTGKRKGR